jgi:hypothetical protein
VREPDGREVARINGARLGTPRHVRDSNFVFAVSPSSGTDSDKAVSVYDLTGKRVGGLPAAYAAESLVVFSRPQRQFTVSGRVVTVWNLDPPGNAGTAPPAALTSKERWQRWQLKFGLTLDDNDDLVPLLKTAARELRGWSGEALPPLTSAQSRVR